MNVKYLGPLKDYSGYGEANRHYVAALDTVGVNVIPELVSYTAESSDFGTLGARIESLYSRPSTSDYKIKILHTTPNVFKRHMEDGKYHIAHFFWETDRVPDDFATGLRLCDEIWTGSEANRQAILSTGVDKPVHIFPQAIEANREWPEKYIITDFDGYLFYSIFEWTDRKNPAGLLNAYWNAFQDGENVGLLIKTYFRGFDTGTRRMIRHQIDILKRRSGLQNFPPVFLYLDLMDRTQVMRVHSTGDCYVSAHRGEGWGVPQVEAALAGNPVISTGYGGCHEYFHDGEDMLIVPYEMTQLHGMDHSSQWYTSQQKWAKPDMDVFIKNMRFCYENPEKSTKIGKKAQKNVISQFNFKTVGDAMKARLTEIEKELL